MKKFFTIAICLAVVLGIYGIVNASMIIPSAEQAQENAKAPEKSPVIGGGWDIERVNFVHYVKPANPAKPPKAETCYKLMGVKWTEFPVNYSINSLNQEGLNESFVLSAISTSAETWDSATSKELFGNYDTGTAQYGVRDYINAIDFGAYPQSGVIAVTSVWYTRVGKKIVEFDIRFNDYWEWGNADNNQNVMDLQNIATHELGHAVGLSDIYSDSCSYVTMFGYSTEGDTIKRDLAQPDITGLQKMYGE